MEDFSTLQIEIEFFYHNTTIKHVKTLRRKSSFGLIPLSTFPRTLGWLNPYSHSSDILKELRIDVAQTFMIVSPCPLNIKNYTNTALTSTEEKSSITRRIGDRTTDGDEVVMYQFEASSRLSLSFESPLMLTLSIELSLCIDLPSST